MTSSVDRALLCLFFVACSRPLRAPTPPPTGERAFVVTMWCGPPLDAFDDARAQEIAAAGFTVVGPPCEGRADPALRMHALDIAARHGLSMWLSDFRFGGPTHKDPRWREYIDAAVADYHAHPAVDGYFVDDEPDAGRFGDLAETVARLAAADPRHPAYINVLPDYAALSLGTSTYREYIDRFLSTVHPRFFSYDYYPFLTGEDRPGFFDNLSVVRELSLRHQVPFFLIVQAMPHGSYRDPTPGELRWQAFHALAFGARGLSYFAYWTPVDVAFAERWQFRHGIVEAGTRTSHHAEVAAINWQARAIAAELAPYHSTAIADTLGKIAPRPSGGLAAVDGGPVTVGLFADGAARGAALVVNRNYREPITIRLRFCLAVRAAEVFDAARRRWIPAGATPLELEPGGARLIRWRGACD